LKSPSPKQVPQRPKVCPADCPGPPKRIHCNYTCGKPSTVVA